MPGWAMVDSGNRVPSQEWPGQESNAQLELSWSGDWQRPQWEGS